MAAFQARARAPLGTVAGVDIADELIEDRGFRERRDGRVVEQEVQLVVPEERQVVEVAAADEDPIVDPQHLGMGHLGVEEDLDAGVHEALVVVAERGGRVGRCRLARSDQANRRRPAGRPRATPPRTARLLMYGLTMSIRSLGRVDRRLHGVADRVVAGPGNVPEDRGGDARLRRLRHDEHVRREPPVERLVRRPGASRPCAASSPGTPAGAGATTGPVTRHMTS